MSSFYTYAKHYGNSILFRGIENGKRVSGKRDFKPTMFVKSDKPSKYKSMYGESVSPIQFDSNKEAAEFAERYKEVSNFPIYGQTNWNYQFLTEKYPNDIEWDINQIKIFSVDIETTVENGFPDVFNPLEKILLITLQDNTTKKITTFGTGPFTQTSETSQYDVDYKQCRDERELLVRFLDWWSVNTPDVLTGWNTDFFDVPYLISRVDRVLDDDYVKVFSPFKLVRRNVKKIMGREQLTYEIQGVAQLDYLALYKKFTYITRPSYKLDNIAETELGKKKLESGFDTFREFYEKDWNRFVEYNIIDTALVDELEDKMKLIELILTMAYDAKCNFQDIFSPVRTWDSLLYNHLWKQNVVLPQSESKESRSIVGAYVQEVEPGEYEWVASFDATSLYPSIIMQYNMSPETLVPGSMMDVTVDGLLEGKYDLSSLKEKNYSMTANGQCFTNDKLGYMPEIVQKFFDDRQKYKKLMLKAKQDLIDTGDDKYKNDISKYNNFQMARKIQLNSLYGAMANQYFRFYDDRIAEGITMSGQHIIRQTAVGLDKFLNKVCGTENEMYSFYSDTDSCYITLKGLVDKYYSKMDKDKLIDVLDKIGDDQIEPCIAKSMDELADYTNSFAKKLVFKREAIADRAIWVAKKRYAMNVYDNEGVRYQTPDLKVMGLEIVRSSTPACVQDSLKEAVRLCLTSDEATLQDYIKKTRKEFVNLPAEDIAFPRGCNNLQKYTDSSNIYASKTPMQVRGSLLYNFYLKKHNLDSKYELIQEGDKIKFLYLKEPNTLSENCISFITKIPEELDIHKYVDYNLMFEKAFLDPMDTIVSALGWHTEKVNTLEDLFS